MNNLTVHTAQSADNEKRFMCWCTNKIILKAAYKRCLLLLCYHALGGSAGPAKMPEAHWQGHFLLGSASALEENQRILTSLAVNWHKTQIWAGEHNRQFWHRANFLLGLLDLLHTRGLMPCLHEWFTMIPSAKISANQAKSKPFASQRLILQ